ncbi:MAG: L-histidine N(alpha)-methyltransferase [Gemmatimonadota bacterium]|nr:MAG: L-histidine N(alpha)-methyltransferase [Gemmatimonadota bacterium]
MTDRPRELMSADVQWGLAQPQKQISSKYFYDTKGSELFEEITRLPEYYPTRTERELLLTHAVGWLEVICPVTLVELGAGSARKTRILLNAMHAADSQAWYVPVDVAGDFIHATAGELRTEYPSLEVHPVVQDIADPLHFAADLRRPVLFALLGSTIGNFERDAAVDMLSNVRRAMSAGDHFLLGADLQPGPRKSTERLTAAYNDSAGVTAAFNLNILTVINRGIGTDFDPDCFSHRAGYDTDEGRIEMHLLSCSDQEVHFPSGEAVRIGKGETIRTEISCKYDLPTIEALFGAAGLSVDRWFQDPDGLYALAVGKPES